MPRAEAAVYLAVLGALSLGCKGQCPAQTLTVTVGYSAGEIEVPALDNGGSFRELCAQVDVGYAGDIEVHCIGSIITADATRCSPRGCSEGQSATAKVGGTNATVTASTSRPLEHGEVQVLWCHDVLEGNHGYSRLHCLWGELTLDLSSCHPEFGDASSVWRISNEDRTPGAWRIFELDFFTGEDCASGQLQGVPVASSDDIQHGEHKHYAFDDDKQTSWSANCETGCQPRTAWIGLSLERPSSKVRCVSFKQSQVSCCASQRVRLEVWDGSTWQTSIVWDIVEPWSPDGIELSVPISCYEGVPDGHGVIHTCGGRPALGMQEGEMCTARCGDGYIGVEQTFKCESDGQLVGDIPTCYDTTFLSTVGSYIGIGAAILLFAQQYKFWMMYRKARLNPKKDIHESMRGRWLEKSGAPSMWDVIIADIMESKEKEAEQLITRQFGSSWNFSSSKMDLPQPAEESKDMMMMVPVATEMEDMKQPEELSQGTGSDTSIPKATSGDKKDEDRKVAQGKKALGLLRFFKSFRKKEDIAWQVDEDAESGPSTPTDRRAHHRKRDLKVTGLDGLCTPCADPEIFWAGTCCCLCRIADTWHTLGAPQFLTYWRVVALYFLNPCLWPCLNYFIRHRIRQTFGIPLEPHRDFCIHCVCCICCTPFAVCQEARLVEAPVALSRIRHKLLPEHH